MPKGHKGERRPADVAGAPAMVGRIATDVIPEMTAADFARAGSLNSALPKVVEAMKRGRPKLACPKRRRAKAG
jgi:hypothetical protein